MYTYVSKLLVKTYQDTAINYQKKKNTKHNHGIPVRWIEKEL